MPLLLPIPAPHLIGRQGHHLLHFRANLYLGGLPYVSPEEWVSRELFLSAPGVVLPLLEVLRSAHGAHIGLVFIRHIRPVQSDRDFFQFLRIVGS